MTGPAWQFIFHPWPAQAQAWEREVAGRTWSARVLGLAILSLLALGLLGRRQRAQRKRLEADRLAALAHSLKTPLAIHKLRCDTLRMGHLDPSRQTEELMRLGQEVDDLTRLIERGLLSLSAGGARPVLDPLGAAWVEDLAEAFRPALEAAGRALETELAEAPILAHGPVLAPCLSTLLENAVHHGAGTVRLSTRVEGGVVRLTVQDEGPGLDAESLGALGRAFQRLRREGEEGFRHEGQGLGLYLLAEVAGQEGWGFALESAPGHGFSAKMDLPLAPP
jgi:signal transduction histidine kinase